MVVVIESPKTKQTTCGRCKATLQYHYMDIEFSIERDHGGGSDRVARISCPACGNMTSVSTTF